MRRKILAIISIIIVCFSMNLYTFATSVTDLQNQKNEAANSKSDAQQELKEVQAEKNETLSAIEELSTQISESQAELDKLNAEVKELEASIKQTEVELAEAQKRQEEQQKALEERIIAQYKSGSISYWDILLSPESPLKFISNLHMFDKIAKYDNDLIASIEKEKETIQANQDKLEEQKAKVKTAKANVEKENVKLKNAKMVKNSKVAQLSEQEKSIQEQIEQYDKMMSELAIKINAAQKANSSNGTSSVTYNGVMAWPVPSSSKITSYFGYRIHPIYHVNKLHAGIDIGGADWGAPFVAADDGTVILARYYGGYGNCVIIDHGGGVSTLYGHGSAIYVKEGQKVTRGQNVLAIGSSGTSTGKHAHFEVRINGSPVDPLPYIT
ncbi:MAG: peptidoglycan DD-metalloendopeptidase family protein [Clostridia bacterium]|nr:peptidoglycan DD-metalloendopeptidase family protein [Clostridia bacterium]